LRFISGLLHATEVADEKTSISPGERVMSLHLNDEWNGESKQRVSDYEEEDHCGGMKNG
jgi:hypothetical protein